MLLLLHLIRFCMSVDLCVSGAFIYVRDSVSDGEFLNWRFADGGMHNDG